MDIKFLSLPLILVILGILSSGCSKPESNDPENTIAAQAKKNNKGIDWFDGSVEQAFASAQAQDKPIFLYWGAKWCPPCNQLKATVFKRADFIEKTKFFVPVYLDGDTERAQIFGDKFAVLGYPTLIVFDSLGTEITRIPGGMEIARYSEVMDLALKHTRPVKALVAQVQNQATLANNNLSSDDFRLLAYYSWGQDNQRVLPKENPAAVLHQLYLACPDSLAVEKSRLYLAYLEAILHQESDETAVEPVLLADEQIRQRELAEINHILKDARLVLANFYALAYEDGNTITALTLPNTRQRKTLLANWRQALDVIIASNSLSEMEKLSPTYALISFNKLENQGHVSEKLQAVIKERVEATRATINNRYEHSAVINMVRNILFHAQMYSYADKVISEEVDKAASPYYFMLELADLAQKEGRTDDALDWLKRAYLQSQAGATRFQWGVQYLRGLLEMTPQDEQKIQNLAVELIKNLGQSEDAFYNRNAKRLHQLNTDLTEWNKDGQHKSTLLAVRNNLQAVCANLAIDTEVRLQCDNFLAEFSS